MKITRYESPLEAAINRVGWGFPMIDRIFSDADGNEGWSAARLPKTNVNETDEGTVITMEMPGLARENVEVNFEGDTLVVKGGASEKKEEKGALRREYRSARFERTFTVGPGLDREKVKAKMENGVLTVTLPKSPESIGRKIEIA